MAIKPSKQVLDSLLGEQRRAKRNVKFGEIIQDGVKTEFWKCVREILTRLKEGVDGRLDNFETMSHDQRTIALAEQKSIEGFLAIENVGLDALEEKHEETKVTSQNYRDILSQHSNGKT